MTRDLDDMLVYDDVNIYSKRLTTASTDEELHQRHYNSVQRFSRGVQRLNCNLMTRNVF